jgi:hypothetical protein
MSKLKTLIQAQPQAVSAPQPGLSPTDTVLVTLSIDAPSGRINVSHNFRADGAEINPDGSLVTKGASLVFPVAAVGAPTTAPELDLDRLKACVEAGDIDGARKLNETFYAAYTAFQASGGGASGPDAVARAVYDFLAKRYNVREADHDGPVLDRSKVIARAVPNGFGGTMYLVQLAPSWG